jgi:hypothetical protein
LGLGFLVLGLGFCNLSSFFGIPIFVCVVAF